QVGPDYRGRTGGGIESVIKTYSENFPGTLFLGSYSEGNKFHEIIYTCKFFLSFTRFMIVKKDIKIVHIHSASDMSFIRKSLTMMIARLFGKKTIMHMHGSTFRVFYEKAGIFRSVIRRLLKCNDLVICLSPQWFDFFSNLIPAAKLRIVNNPVPAPAMNISRQQNGVVKFLFLGRIGNRKGIFDLLKAMSLLNPELRRSANLTIGGNGEVQKLQELIKSLALQDCVNYAGWVDGQLKTELLAAADVYILPSYNEGLPVSILEAMAYGLPIISTPIGGIPEVVKEGINGFLVEPGNIQQIIDKIEKMIKSPDLPPEMGKASLQTVKPFTADSVFPVLDTIYASLLVK
ncbi:MAG: hypothetical protein JWM28_1523, partial [Chitinophagaceae bacterium]|nr:hypothetical protein [Chitinophagaceae bacterium]